MPYRDLPETGVQVNNTVTRTLLPCLPVGNSGDAVSPGDWFHDISNNLILESNV